MINMKQTSDAAPGSEQAPEQAPKLDGIIPSASTELSVRRLPKQGLRRKLWLVLALTMLVQAGATAGALALLQGPWRQSHRFDHAQALADLTASEVSKHQIIQHNPIAQRALDRLVNSESVRSAQVVAHDGRVLLSSGDPAPADELRSETFTASLGDPDDIAEGDGPPPASVVLTVEDFATQRALLDGAIALGAGLLFSSLIALPMACVRIRRWTGGLRELQTAIRRLALDTPLQPVQISGDHEVAYLSVAFNDMAARLSASRRELVATNQSLERRVVERTEELHTTNKVLERQNVKLEELTNTAMRFTDDVAHEFRTPLSVIGEFATIIIDGFGGEVTEQQNEYLRFIANASDDLARLVDDFLDSSKLRSRSLRTERSAHKAEEILDSVWPMIQSRSSGAEVTVERIIDPDTPLLYVDAEKTGRALINLAVNAFKFSGKGTTVTIRASKTNEGDIRISVTDQGPGLTPDEVGRLFERFKQTCSGVRSNVKGFGIGLNIVRELVEINFGRVIVESTPGEGSTFSMILPSDDPERIVEMFLASAAGRSPDRAIGIMELVRTGAQEGAEEFSAFLSGVLYPMDLQFPSADGESTLLVGQTLDVDAWSSRIHTDYNILRNELQDTRLGIIRSKDAETRYISQAKDRILERLPANSPALNARAA